jgi:hypothetical protein
MKIALIIIGILICLFILFQIYTSMATSETQTYNVIKAEEEYEIRYYPAATMAMITSSATTYKELGFRFHKTSGLYFWWQ